jgi:hypothetical protein
MKQVVVIAALAGSVIVASASAQSGTTPAKADRVLDLTIQLMPANAELPAVVTAAIELPQDGAGEYVSSAQGVERSARGVETANLAREDARALGEAAAAAARDDRENATRASRPDLAADPAPAPDRPTPPSR